MKTTPILFNGDMVRALIDGRKTQTRRVMKSQPFFDGEFWCWHSKCRGKNYKYSSDDERFISKYLADHIIKYDLSEYGSAGDLLWVREGFSIFGGEPIYKADGVCYDERPLWKPSIHMPRWASRLTLEITDIRVERLQDISEEDAIAEGIAECDLAMEEHESGACYQYKFLKLWDKINGEKSTDANPWVWVIEFKVHHQNIDNYMNARAA